MTDLIVVPQAAGWRRLKGLVLDSVSSPITRRVYNLGLDEFFEWYGREPRPGFTKATVAAWRVALEVRGLPVRIDEHCSQRDEGLSCTAFGDCCDLKHKMAAIRGITWPRSVPLVFIY